MPEEEKHSLSKEEIKESKLNKQILSNIETIYSKDSAHGKYQSTMSDSKMTLIASLATFGVFIFMVIVSIALFNTVFKDARPTRVSELKEESGETEVVDIPETPCRPGYEIPDGACNAIYSIGFDISPGNKFLSNSAYIKLSKLEQKPSPVLDESSWVPFEEKVGNVQVYLDFPDGTTQQYLFSLLNRDGTWEVDNVSPIE